MVCIRQQRQMNIKYPYNEFIVDKSEVENKDIKEIATKKLGEVQSYNELEGLNIPDIRVYEGECLWRNFQMLVINEDSC